MTNTESEMAGFHDFMARCDKVLAGAVGLTSSDLGDANWYDYYEDEMDPREAAVRCLLDYNDFPSDLIEEVGLGDWI
jgi:hypothetical protein